MQRNICHRWVGLGWVGSGILSCRWVGLGSVEEMMGWVGLGYEIWTHGHVWTNSSVCFVSVHT